ncbi:MAG: shikimate kinase [Planctomycetota bacterium]
MKARRLIVLCGLRCSGKTTTGRLLASRLGTPFSDLDEIVAAAEGASAAEIITDRGLDAFREAERRSLERFLATPERRGVLALGGGAPTHPPLAKLLTNAANDGHLVIVYLRAAPVVLAARLRSPANAGSRPTLTQGASDPSAEVEQLFEERDPLYSSLAGLVVETDELGNEAVADRVLAAVNAD